MTVTFGLRLLFDGSPSHEQTFCRLPPPAAQGYQVQWLLTAGCQKSPILNINYPTSERLFIRDKFQSIPFELEQLSDPVAQLTILIPGVYEYYVSYDGGIGKRGTLVVEPRLSIRGQEELVLPLDAINLLTVVPKWLPPLSKWQNHFQNYANTGYNMVHFAPLNQRGISNSPYALYDQLSISPDLFDVPMSKEEQEKLLIQTLDQIKNMGIIPVTDIVWNHTACNSEWLEIHPDAGYNLKNSPHLKSAYELDEAIIQFSGNLEKYNLPMNIHNEQDLQSIMNVWDSTIFPSIALWEFYVMNVDELMSEFKENWSKRNLLDYPSHLFKEFKISQMSGMERAQTLLNKGLNIHAQMNRFAKKIQWSVSIPFMEQWITEGANEPFELYYGVLKDINLIFYQEFDVDKQVIHDQLMNRIRYLRLSDHGPKIGSISRERPLVDTYFTRLPITEHTKQKSQDELVLANNGWIWNADPLVNFAEYPSKAYLRREVIPWGDCVKLRYGASAMDNPWLWSYMEDYTHKMAHFFDGFRIDNCHSTPIHVATHLLDVARSVKPDLYVFAELFTGSEEKDILFVSKLGIHSLIREALNAWDPQELSRLAHRYGGQPVGSLSLRPEYLPLELLGHSICSGPSSPSPDLFVELKGSTPHALFMECTHDNETPHQKRTAEDTLTNSAIVCMSSCAMGSVKGYDEIVPELLDLVKESRKYRVADDSEGILPSKRIFLPLHAKMAREGYSEIHVHQENDFISIHRVHPVTHDGYLLIARTAFRRDVVFTGHAPIHLVGQEAELIQTATLTVQVAVPKVAHSNISSKEASPIHSTQLKRSVSDEMVNKPVSPLLDPLAALETTDDHLFHPIGPATLSSLYHSMGMSMTNVIEAKRAAIHMRKLGVITGLPSTLHFSTSTCAWIDQQNSKTETRINVLADKVSPGSIVLLRTWARGSGVSSDPVHRCKTPSVLHEEYSHFIHQSLTYSDEGPYQKLWLMLGLQQGYHAIEYMVKMGWLEGAWITDKSKWPPELWKAVNDLGPAELNIALYRVQEEEEDFFPGHGVYNIPGHGALAYCGIQGFISVLQSLARNNDLGHALCDNLRAGPWMCQYVYQRLLLYVKEYPKLAELCRWLQERLLLVESMAPSYKPKYFSLVMYLVYQGLRYKALSLVESKPIIPSSTGTLSQNCELALFQMNGKVRSTGLFPREYSFSIKDSGLSLAAGLPHFAIRHMRCWGRDIFISFPGLLLLTGQWDNAKALLIAFGSVVRHGLIPNLLDQGKFPRYNARDATWWWLYALQLYCQTSPEGYDILKCSVGRRFIPCARYRSGPDYLKSNDDLIEKKPPQVDTYIDWMDGQVYQYTSTIAEICYEILERHARGIQFREWNAGPSLDHAMSSEGFNVECGVHWDTGFVYGGNEYNCGTWMDKMGDSEKAGNKGIPATPRDGSPIEIVGLQKATLHWITRELSQRKRVWSFDSVTLKDGSKVSFNEWNTLVQKSFEAHFHVPLDTQEPLANVKGIYKDVVGSKCQYADYQLRPNFTVAMVVAPELFSTEKAIMALEIAKTRLCGPLGIKTLDPSDWAYRPNYDNSNDSTDASIAHGHNYHQGPEWLWIHGYFLRAYLKFKSKTCSKSQLIHTLQQDLLPHKQCFLDLKKNPYAGLPELTNDHGIECYDSCPTQTWSSAVFLELIHEMRNLE